MATRNLTRKFEQFRATAKSRREAGSHRRQNSDGREALLDEGEPDSSTGIKPVLPPQWVDIVQSLQTDIATIKTKLKELQTLHNERLKVNFSPEQEKEKERDIDIMTGEVTRLLKKSENGLKRIATIGNTKGENLSKEERTVRLNVMRNFATVLQSLSKDFRHCQKDFLMRLKGQDEVGSQFFMDDKEGGQKLSLDEVLDRGLTTEQSQQLQLMEQKASEREKEIIHIAQSINDLAAIFRELNVLVIEQGTILDRIDYHVEQTLVKVREGVKELREANETSKKARTLKCIVALILINIILGIALYFQKGQ